MGRKKNVTIPLKFITIEKQGGHLYIPVTVNKKRARFIVDTGASQTVMDKNRVQKFTGNNNHEQLPLLSTGLGTSKMESHVTEIKSLGLGKMEIRNFKMILLDLSHVNFSYEQIGMKPVDGVLGGDIFKKFRAVIDYRKMILKLRVK